MSAAITAAVVGAGISAAAASDSQRKAIHAQQDAQKAATVDIDALNQQTKDIARQNAIDSAALEKQLTPEVSQFRTAGMNNLLNQVNAGTASSDKYRAILEAQLGKSLNTPLVNDAIAKARSDLALGGQLSQDVQNAVIRRGLANAGSVGGGLGLGRDVSSRDLGLTSLQLEQQRLANAFNGGGLELNRETANSTDLLNHIQMLQSLNNGERNFALNAANFGQSIAQPIVGLDPSAIANLKTGNQTVAAGSLGRSNRSCAAATASSSPGPSARTFIDRTLVEGLSAS